MLYQSHTNHTSHDVFKAPCRPRSECLCRSIRRCTCNPQAIGICFETTNTRSHTDGLQGYARHYVERKPHTRETNYAWYIYAAQQAYKAQEISNIGFVRSSHSLDDGISKPTVQAALYQLLNTAHHKPKVEQWIIRDPQWCTIHHYSVRKHEPYIV